jgi:hypothetical protein
MGRIASNAPLNPLSALVPSRADVGGSSADTAMTVATHAG